MKKLILAVLLISISLANAQVIIGDAVGTASNKTSVLLEFAAGQNKGIIVPYVRTLPTSPTPGTIILDATTATAARMKFYNGTAWQDLSGQDGNVTTALTSQPTGITETGKSIIGADTSPADGVLVLESTSKAMVLPTVTDVQNIPSPSPGMMVYVKGSTKLLAVYNGSKWSFWKP
ncbi:hypothetical protein [Epilithonimonas sp. UC225_85]|uniref:hypothetical protein n=1 Tax=Epilithonimonas sp. UC225_85 TaxID=3350167 RepID=UPI0036D2C43C